MRGCRKLVAKRPAHIGDIKHMRKRLFLTRSNLKNLGRSFPRHYRRERPESLALLDQRIDALTHPRISRVRQDAATAQGPWPKLHAILEPPDNLSPADPERDFFAKLFKRSRRHDVE